MHDAASHEGRRLRQQQEASTVFQLEWAGVSAVLTCEGVGNVTEFMPVNCSVEWQRWNRQVECGWRQAHWAARWDSRACFD